jgi:hypothetical protein
MSRRVLPDGHSPAPIYEMASRVSVIERARRYVQKCDRAISGQHGHDRAFRVAAVLVHRFALSENDALAVMREWNAMCVPPWSESELVHKIQSARAAVHQKPRGWLLECGMSNDECRIPVNGQNGAQGTDRPAPPRPKFKPSVLRRIAAKVSEIANVVRLVSERSPVRVETQDSASFLRRMYRRGSGEKVLIFSNMRSRGQFLWEADRSDVVQNIHLPRGSEGIWFLPQPVTGEFYPNPRQGGELSRRSEEGVTSWRYAVLESDEADPDDWLRCLIQMPLRIASICESGGRSIHALVRLDAASKAEWDGWIAAIKPILVTLGACPGTLSAVRLTRLPQAKRGARVQRLLYLNPEPIAAPIYSGGGTKEAR